MARGGCVVFVAVVVVVCLSLLLVDWLLVGRSIVSIAAKFLDFGQ